MDLTLTELGLEMFQEDEELVWELNVPSGAVLRMSHEDLEHLIYRLSDELHAMEYGGTREDYSGDEGLPERTDRVDVEMTSGSAALSALTSLIEDDDDDWDF